MMAMGWSEEALIRQFNEMVHHKDIPKGFLEYRPTIPLVGKGFQPGKGLLVYGSAENLTHHDEGSEGADDWFRDERVMNRHRAALEFSPKNKVTRPFPFVGIAPIEGGDLLSAARLVAMKRGLPETTDSRAFLDTLAVTNWCKFVRVPGEGKRNRDYVRYPHLLEHSLPYVLAEFKALRPAVALLPLGILKVPRFQAAMLKVSPRTVFIGAYQCNARATNCHLKPIFEPMVEGFKKSRNGHHLAGWVKDTKHAWLWIYLAMLDRLLMKDAVDNCILYNSSAR